MCDLNEAEALLAQCSQPCWLYQFPRDAGVPHTMLSLRDRSPQQAVTRIADMAAQFFSTGIGQNTGADRTDWRRAAERNARRRLP